jgi:long-chain acyl-CoA synthetase
MTVATACPTVSTAELMHKLRDLSGDPTEANGHLTPTLKVRRSRVFKDVEANIDGRHRS